MASNRRLMSRSAESEAPMAFSRSSRWTRSSSGESSCPEKSRICVVSRLPLICASASPSLDADGTHFLDVRQPHERLLDAVLLERVHAFLQADRKHLRNARVLLDRLLHPVARNQQLMQSEAPLHSTAAAAIAAYWLVQGELPLLIAVVLDPLLVHRFHCAPCVLLERFGTHQLLAILIQQRSEFVRIGRVGLLALAAEALGEALRKNAEQGVREVERVHAHVEQADDRLGRRVGMQGGENQMAGERGLDAERGRF